MIFNNTGRNLRKQFSIEGKYLESVSTFCYLGFEVKPSGTVSHAMSVLHEKAKKAMRSIMCAIYRFNLPVKLAIKLFHTYISPIILYNVENWTILTEKKLNKQFKKTDIYDEIDTSKTDIIHRKLLKNVIGVSKSCPNMALYGELGDLPLSLKGYRIMLNNWHRLKNLPNDSLLKKALFVNTELRTGWIQTVERLIKSFDLVMETNSVTHKFQEKTKKNIQEYYTYIWKEKINESNSSRLKVYKAINNKFIPPKHLILPLHMRKLISKIRCSDHHLEIERGRHLKIDQAKRICTNCCLGAVEDEKHFLIECTTYQGVREKYNMQAVSLHDFLNTENQGNLAKYLKEAYELRDKLLNRQHL